jgi:amidohydrolase
MPIRNRIIDLAVEMTEYRRLLHQNPQLMFEETFASDFVASKLTEWGIQFERGWATTGIIATIPGRKNTSGKAIGLRGDMDALPILEESNQPWASKNKGCMHACGHDGHTTMLLGTAKYLKENPNFDGTVHLIFQPAEEGGGGAMRMIEQGLFDKFNINDVYAVHNAPYAPVGLMATRTGPIMACSDEIYMTLKGRGGHAAMPHTTNDPVVVACKLVSALQTIVSRNVDPMENAVISITNIHAGSGATNIIPETVEITGTVRAFNPAVRDLMEARIATMAKGMADAFDMECTFRYERNYEPTINEAESTQKALKAARAVVGDQAVMDNGPAMMGAEDFGAMLMKKPGNYMWVGQATGDPNSPHNQGLHHPKYDFNDAIIPIVMEYFTNIVEQNLPLDK